MTAPAPNDLLERPNQRVSAIFCIFSCLVVWFARPLSWIPLGFVDLPHHLELPVETLLALLSVPVIISARRRLHPAAMAGAGLYLAFLLFNWIKFQSHFTQGARLAAFVLVPWAAAIVFSVPKQRNRLTVCLAALWCWQIVLGLWCIAFSQEVIGSTGNRNWAGALILALSPWAWQLASRVSRVQLRRGLYGGIATLTTVMLIQCRSRGAWLALIICIFAAVLIRLRWRWRIALTVGLSACATIAFLSNPMWLAKELQKDIRLPVTARTIAMMIDNDLSAWGMAALIGKAGPPNSQTESLRPKGPYGVAGVGPGQYRRAFAPYRATSTYSERGVAAATTIHPHNEWLHIAAQIGLPAAIAWFLLIVCPMPHSLKRKKPEDTDRFRYDLCALSVLSLLVCGIFDMPLFERPTSILFLILSGMIWIPTPTATKPSPAERPRLALTGLSLLAALCIGGNLLTRDFRITQLTRQAYIQETFRKNSEPARDYYLQAAQLSPSPSRLLLFAGSITLNKLNDSKNALIYLKKAAEGAPNIGHVNQELARALMSEGNHHEALQYLDRERRLFPNNPEAWYRLYTGLFFSGQFSEVGNLSTKIPYVWVKRTNQALGEPTYRSVRQKWHESMAATEIAEARKAASALVAPASTNLADPLLYVLAGEHAKDLAHAAQAPFDDRDVRYWQEVLAVAQLAPGTHKSPESLIDTISANITCSPYVQTEPPISKLAQGDSIKPTTCATVLIAAARLHGIPAFASSWENKPAALLLNSPTSGILVVPSDNWAQIDAPLRHPAKIDFPIQAYLSRNQILLSVVMNGAAPPIPSSELIRLFAWLREAPSGTTLGDYCEVPLGIETIGKDE